MASPNSSRRAFFVLFTASGFSGLIYESIWSHYLKLFLGHAAYAQTLVLAIFMGGMAIGSWWISARSTRLRNLLLGYAIVEGVVGLLGLTFHPLSRAATSWTFDTVLPALGSPVPILLFKWTLASLLILPQSILLGMTFPLMSGAIVRRFPQQSGETLSMLYFTNSFGAAVGVLVSGFLLINKVGLPGTIMTAGLLNVALALVVWAIGKNADAEHMPSKSAADQASSTFISERVQRLVLITALATGAAAFMYEIAWLRMLALVLGSSTHAFELMLSAFILGIALGGLWIRKRIQVLVDPLRTLGLVMLLMSVVALTTLHFYGASFGWMSAVVRMFTPTSEGYVGFNLGSHAIALVLMVPTTFFCGLTLPIMTNVLFRSAAGERSIGAVYAWNTVGAIVGIVLAVHVIMPLLGVKAVMIAGALVHAGFGLTFLLRNRAHWRFADGTAVAAACVALIAALFVVRFDPLQMAAGVYRHGRPSYAPGTKVLYFRDGKTASISLVEADGSVSIATNGKPDAAIAMTSDEATTDEITMVLAGALPLAIHPGAKTVANIGIGSGLTTHVLLEDPALTVVDTVEIEPFMAEAAKLGFLARVRNTFEDPRSHIHIEDAKTFFATRQQEYDVIVSEPSNPWVSGVASLFSSEFYGQIKSYLKPDGLMVQWIQIYETDLATVTSVLKALGGQFSDFSLYRTDDANILILAVQQGQVPALDGERLFAGDRRQALRRVGVNTLRDVSARFVGNKALLMPAIAASGVPANSDYFPYVDQNAIRARVLQQNALSITQLSSRAVPILDMLLGKPAPESDLGTVTKDSNYLDRLVRGARGIYSAVVLGTDAELGTESVQQLEMLRVTAEQCGSKAVRDAWLDTTFAFATTATPTLSRTQLEQFWAAIERTPCASTLQGGDRTFLRLMQAVSFRRNAEVLSLGRQLLAPGYAFGSGRQLDFASIATAAAAIAQGEMATARSVLDHINRGALEAWDRAVLTALASASGPPVPAMAQ